MKHGGSWLRGALASTAGIAVAMAVMNIGTYAFQIVAARLLGPVEYGAIASLMSLLLMVGVVQLALQATAARRIAEAPSNIHAIEQEILRTTYRVAIGLALLLLAAAPLINWFLKLDSLLTAALVSAASVPLTIVGGQAGILQGERRWLPLALVYMAVGIPRVLLGGLLLFFFPNAAVGMAAVAIGLTIPVAIGWRALRVRHSKPSPNANLPSTRSALREATHNGQALLAFYALVNVDILIARSTLDSHEAGLYAAGLILAKAVLFLPQFVIVVAFPSMARADERRDALWRGIGVVGVVGLTAIAGAALLSGLAMVFVGGTAFAEVESDLWLFAVLGTLTAMLQLLVYAVLARQGRRTIYLIWLTVAVVVLAGVSLDLTRESLLLLFLAADALLLAVLLIISHYRNREELSARVSAPGPLESQ